MLPEGAKLRPIMMEKVTAMSRDDTDYLEQRAEVQLELAQNATDPRAVQAHYDLANAYLDRIYGQDEDGEPVRDAA